MKYVRQRPRHPRGEDGDGHEHEVKDRHGGEVAGPHAATVHPGGIGVGF